MCTTDDPCDDLKYHEIVEKAKTVKMFPTFRPDKAYTFEDPAAYGKYIARLSQASGVEINSLSALLKAMENRMDFFHNHGCRVADHGLERLPSVNLSMVDANALFSGVLKEMY